MRLGLKPYLFFVLYSTLKGGVSENMMITISLILAIFNIYQAILNPSIYAGVISHMKMDFSPKCFDTTYSKPSLAAARILSCGFYKTKLHLLKYSFCYFVLLNHTMQSCDSGINF